MRTFLLVFSLVILVHASYASTQDSILRAYKIINEAELSVCKNDRRAAFKKYGEAYHILGSKMTSKNLYNYFLVCVDLKKYEDTKPLLIELKKRGWTKSNFKGIIARYYSEKVTNELLGLYESLNSVESSTDTSYTSIIESICQKDQYTNRYLRSLNNGLLEGAAGDSFNRLTKNHIYQLASLFSAKFPTDAVLERSTPMGPLRYHAVLWHNAQGYKDHVLDTIFYKAVLNSDLEVADFENYVIDFNTVNGDDSTILKYGGQDFDIHIYPYDFLTFNDSLFMFPLAPGRAEKYDQNRVALKVLSSLEDMKAKIVFQYYSRMKYKFVSNDYIMQIDLPADIKKHLIYLPKPASL